MSDPDHDPGFYGHHACHEPASQGEDDDGFNVPPTAPSGNRQGAGSRFGPGVALSAAVLLIVKAIALLWSLIG